MKRKIVVARLKRALLALCIVTAAGMDFSPASASELVYYPLNPSFGGSPLNGPVLLNAAQAQNKHTDPSSSSARASLTPKTPLEQFNETLERSIMSRLAANASAAISGPGFGLQPGSVETGNFIIDIVDLGGGMLRITTTDKTNGTSSSFEVAS